jgi:hypothetical protein
MIISSYHLNFYHCIASSIYLSTIYNLCQENYLFDFLFSSKIWNQDVRFSHLNSWLFAQRIKISETKTDRQLDFSDKTWKFTSSSFLIIQLCKNFFSIRLYELFLDNFFINARLFKVLKTMNIEICETIKVESDFSTNLMRLRIAVTKKKHWKKIKLMIIEINKKMNIDEENILYMIWMNLNIVQFMIIMHTINDLKKMTYKNVEKRHEIFNVVNRNSAILIDETWKISFSISIVEYNTHMKESDENAQQRIYYSSQNRLDSRYWWSIFIFFLKTVVLNAFKLWKLLNSQSKMIHLKFQQQIVESLLASVDQTRQISSIVAIISTDMSDASSSCEWKHMNKSFYCVLCKVQVAKLRKRKTLKKIVSNFIKRRRESQTIWRCSNYDSCCKKIACWEKLHDDSDN